MAANAVVGIDEVGRGCWAGPLVASAVLLDKPIEGLRDSKKLSKKRREVLAEKIKYEAKAYGVGWVNADEVDKMGLSKAVQTAMLQAIQQLNKVTTDYDDIIIDGNINYFLNRNGERLDLTPSAKGTLQQRENIVDGVRSNLSPRVRAVVGADAIYAEVSAASILAKVERDAYMTELAESYPGYGFEKHVGYGTAAHVAALAKLGPIRGIHRYSYAPIKKLLDPVS
ncbi:MAG: ribonuclease [Patescibacteria group bacterium]|nr:ribonuclease HII [Candidatus Saccharibacteria bacterium]MDQ5962963.1 ribonuclease [Patescibacteria group bacterium]